MYKEEIVSRIVKKYGSSFYLVDLNIFESNFNNLKKSFMSVWPHFNIAYSFKTNYMPCICSKVKELNGFAEVVSEMELKLARKVGFSFDRIIWNGPIKNKKVLKNFLVNGGISNIDNIKELEYILTVCRHFPKQKFRVGIRLNFSVGDSVVSRFGVDCDNGDLEYVLKQLKSIPNISLCSLQCHFANREVEHWPNRAQGLFNVFKRFKSYFSEIEFLDFGGGIYGEMPEYLAKQIKANCATFDDYANAIGAPLADCFINDIKKPTILVEPGTALVSNALYFFCEVNNIKRVQDKWIATTNGSQKNISMNNINPPIEIYSFSKEQKSFNGLDIVGYTCIENDILYRNYNGLLGEGDIVSFGNCGSYSIVMKPPFILPNCPVLSFEKDVWKLEKRQERFQDIFKTYTFKGAFRK